MKNTHANHLGEQEHEVGYAYPSSEHATMLGRKREGCFTLTTAKVDMPFETYDQAVKKAAELKTNPGRWSMDHALNVHFYPHLNVANQHMERAVA